MGLKEIDKTIAVIQYALKKKRKRVENMSTNLELDENKRIFIGQELELIQNVEALIKAVKHDFQASLGKIPPQALDLEEAILGALMLEKQAIESVGSYLKAEHFYSEAHQLIYKAITALQAKAEPIDMRTVVNQLRVSGDIETIGGAFYIAELTSKVSSAANIDFHGRVVVEFAMKRQIIKTCSECLLDAYDDTTDAFMLFDKYEESTKTIRSWIKK